MVVLIEVVILLFFYGVGFAIDRYTSAPGSLVAMGLLFVALHFQWLKEKHLARITPFLLAHLALFFISPALRVFNSLELLQGNIVKLLLLLVISNMLVMGVTGFVVQKMVERREV